MDIKMVVGWILVVGAVNWGLVGLMDTNLVESLLGMGTMLTKGVYVVVGAAGVYKAYVMVTNMKQWGFGNYSENPDKYLGDEKPSALENEVYPTSVNKLLAQLKSSQSQVGEPAAAVYPNPYATFLAPKESENSASVSRPFDPANG